MIFFEGHVLVYLHPSLCSFGMCMLRGCLHPNYRAIFASERSGVEVRVRVILREVDIKSARSDG